MTIPVDKQNLISSLGIQDLPPERKLELIDQVSDLVEKRILLRVLSSFTPEQKKQFDDLLDTENQEAITEFMRSAAPEIPQWVEEEISRAKDELAGLAASID